MASGHGPLHQSSQEAVARPTLVEVGNMSAIVGRARAKVARARSIWGSFRAVVGRFQADVGSFRAEFECWPNLADLGQHWPNSSRSVRIRTIFG